MVFDVLCASQLVMVVVSAGMAVGIQTGIGNRAFTIITAEPFLPRVGAWTGRLQDMAALWNLINVIIELVSYGIWSGFTQIVFSHKTLHNDHV